MKMPYSTWPLVHFWLFFAKYQFVKTNAGSQEEQREHTVAVGWCGRTCQPYSYILDEIKRLDCGQRQTCCNSPNSRDNKGLNKQLSGLCALTNSPERNTVASKYCHVVQMLSVTALPSSGNLWHGEEALLYVHAMLKKKRKSY